ALKNSVLLYVTLVGFRPVYSVSQIDRTKRTNYFFFFFLMIRAEYEMKSMIKKSINGKGIVILHHFA
ncbi:hypothetical protein DXB50_13620, partial [Butyricicoccus sp. OM04-18BH]